MGRGDGIFLLVRVTLKAYTLDLVDRNDEHIEICGVNVELRGGNNNNIFGIYRPPAGNHDLLDLTNSLIYQDLLDLYVYYFKTVYVCIYSYHK